jgi:hypothetical protein
MAQQLSKKQRRTALARMGASAPTASPGAQL